MKKLALLFFGVVAAFAFMFSSAKEAKAFYYNNFSNFGYGYNTRFYSPLANYGNYYYTAPYNYYYNYPYYYGYRNFYPYNYWNTYYRPFLNNFYGGCGWGGCRW